MRRAGLLLVAAVVAAFSAGCFSPADTKEVAAYRGGSITRGDLERFAQSRRGTGSRQKRLDGATRRRFLRELACREILLAEATPPGEELRRIGEAAADEVLVAAMRERLGWDGVEIGEEEARAFHAEHAVEFGRPERLRLQHIFLRARGDGEDPTRRDEVRERLERLRERAVAGEDFGRLARRHSESADRTTGGWMMLERGSGAVRAFTDAVWELEEGEISAVIESASGFHVAKLGSRMPAMGRSFEVVREAVIERLRETRVEALEQRYLEENGPLHGFERHYSVLRDRDVAPEAALFTLGGESYTLATLLDELPKRTYLPHFYGGYFVRIEELLDREALRRVLVKAARRTLPEEAELAVEADRGRWSAQTTHLLERRLELWAQAVDEERLWDHYEEEKARYRLPRLRSVSVLRLPPSRSENLWVTVARAESLAAEIREGADFAELAREHSHHVSSRSGGRLIDLTDDELAAQVHGGMRSRRFVDGLEVGEMSEPFIGEVHDPEIGRDVPTGVYLVRLDAETPIRQASFREAREEVRASFLRRHRAAALEAVIEATLSHGEFRPLDR